jgi:hypothetical protein
MLLSSTFSKDLVPPLNGMLYQMVRQLFLLPRLPDKNIMGLRGSNLLMSHELIYGVFRYVAENLVLPHQVR